MLGLPLEEIVGRKQSCARLDESLEVKYPGRRDALVVLLDWNQPRPRSVERATTIPIPRLACSARNDLVHCVDNPL